MHEQPDTFTPCLCIYYAGPVDHKDTTSHRSVQSLLSKSRFGACSRRLPERATSPDVPCLRMDSGVTFARWKRVETRSPKCAHTRSQLRTLRRAAYVSAIGTKSICWPKPPCESVLRPPCSLLYECTIDALLCHFVQYFVSEYICSCLCHIPRRLESCSRTWLIWFSLWGCGNTSQPKPKSVQLREHPIKRAQR